MSNLVVYAVKGVTIADARILVPGLEVIDDQPELAEKLLNKAAEWALRYTPSVTIDLPDGLILNITGCTHLWGGERPYFKEIILKLLNRRYHVRGATADTIGAAWGWSRFGSGTPIIQNGDQETVLAPLSPAALQLEPEVLTKLRKLGIRSIGTILRQPRLSLSPRFGNGLLQRLDQALGKAIEVVTPIRPIEPYQERLACLEPIRTAGGIEIALTRLLEMLCRRLQDEGKGIRSAVLSAFRTDGDLQHIMIGTSRASHNINHLFKLFSEKIGTFKPELGFEVFSLEAPKVEDILPLQESLWGGPSSIDSISLAELIDRLTNKMGENVIHRYLPAEHHWPERPVKLATSLQDKPSASWQQSWSIPIFQLPKPEPIEVSAPIPDYPPMNFSYKGKLHTVQKADGPKRIVDEWWIQEARFRDYYAVEDTDGCRYWLFRSGDYADTRPVRWFIHGFF